MDTTRHALISKIPEQYFEKKLRLKGNFSFSGKDVRKVVHKFGNLNRTSKELKQSSRYIFTKIAGNTFLYSREIFVAE